MKWIDEFKKFAMRGNVVDMAVGIIIGGAFGKIVSSFVADVVMPPLGMMMGGMDFSTMAITLKEAVGEQPAVLLKYGAFITAVLDFVIVALAIFMMIKALNSLKRKQAEAPAAPPAPSKQEVLLEEIRDLLRNK